MRINGMAQRILLVISRKIKTGYEKKKLIAAFLIFVILFLLLGITRQTLGIFSRSFVLTDSAMAAKFDVMITAPKEFWPQQGDSNFEYRFLSEMDFRGFVFQVTNNGEAEVLCKPHINSDVTYRVYVEEEARDEFIVAAKETVSFWLIIAPDGLDANIRNAELLIDIQQMEWR